MRRSVFWKVAGILVGVQVATGLLAVGLSAWFANDRSLDLAANSLRLRLDDLAQEVEQRADSLLTDGLTTLAVPLRLDLARRFPDPVLLLDEQGNRVSTIWPDTEEFPDVAMESEVAAMLPDELADLLTQGDIIVQLDAQQPEGTWGLTPVYDLDGFLVGGLLVQPLTQSMARELAGTREAYRQTLYVVAALAGLIALLIGAFFTGQLVRPLRRMTKQVERIGAGEYATRIAVRGEDEFGRLAAAINQMAQAVEHSVETLRATDQLRRELIANVGHDLRTPLATLLGYLEEAKRHLEGERKVAADEALTRARRQGLYLSQLVSDLFELSLLDSGPAPLRREPIPLSELLNDAAHAHRVAFEQAGITFQKEVPSTLPMIHGDGVRLLRVLDNLLANALRHTYAGGCVTLRAATTTQAVEIKVEDTGSGMGAEMLAHIFDRYYRGEEARTRQGGGTGLGLAISRAIARAHSGELTAESTPGKGSTFILHLPLGRDEDA
ncbi:MAG TPA: HAMP domain-containing sensor histidine kinase [Rhodothermales bacterium]|nr:HAMP domain-containing sensor histidine kinase [Rhodothermales bacterium]